MSHNSSQLKGFTMSLIFFTTDFCYTCAPRLHAAFLDGPDPTRENACVRSTAKSRRLVASVFVCDTASYPPTSLLFRLKRRNFGKLTLPSR
jgi:hypothetical protein